MFKPKKSAMVAVAIASLAALAFAGCASSTPSASSSSGSSKNVTLNFANADPAATWAPVIAAFEKKNPGITVHQLNVPYAQFTSTITQRLTQGNAALDLFVVDRGWLKDYSNRGFVANLNDLKPAATAAALTPDMVTANVIDGKLLALEPWTTSQFLFYNKDVLAKAGVTPPSADPAHPSTWEQIVADAQKIKATAAAQYPLMFDQFDSYYELQPLGFSAGGGEAMKTTTASFSNTGWQKALTFYHNLFADGLAPRGITNDKTNALFTGGKAGLILTGPWGLGLSNTAKLNYGIAAAPIFEGGKATTASDSWSVAVSAKSTQQAAAKKFLSYLTINPEGNKISAATAGITPTTKVAYAPYAVTANASGGAASKEFGALLQYNLKNSAVHRPNKAGYTIFESEANKMFSDIRNGSDPMTRAQQADTTITAQLKRLG